MKKYINKFWTGVEKIFISLVYILIVILFFFGTLFLFLEDTGILELIIDYYIID